ncbi:MAG TPA: HAMP domain-containing sensor histidine kinase [Polyangiaceae bacterium]
MTRASRGAGRRGPRLLLRIYGYGVLMLALATGASFLVGTYFFQPVAEGPSRPSTAWIAWHLMAIADQRDVLRRELADLKKRSNIEMTLFDADGRRIDTNATEPPPALSPAELAELARNRTHFAEGVGRVAELGPDGRVSRYVRVRYPLPVLPKGVAAVQLAVALGVLALISIPLARSLAGPVERLAALARSFGAGDLARRAESERRDEIGDLARAFDEMADRIAAMRRSEKELLANVSHELRTPLARIRLALELVRSGDATRADSYLTDIEDDLAELEQLLEGVMTAARLDLARGEAGDALPPLRKAELPGDTLLKAAIVRFRIHHPDRTLTAQELPELPVVLADPAMLRRVLDNLLDNAVKFSEPGDPIELEAARRPENGEPEALLIRVRDHGMGIAPGDLPRVFEPFFRSDKSRARATGGVGLGLAIARRVVEAHGGSIAVESSEGAGTCFTIALPAHAPADDARDGR